MAIESDLELMLRVSRGDTESFEALLRRHRTPLLNYFSRMVQDPALAEDLAQELSCGCIKHARVTSRRRCSPPGFTGLRPTWL